jgi:hypothetical protein
MAGYRANCTVTFTFYVFCFQLRCFTILSVAKLMQSGVDELIRKHIFGGMLTEEN